MYAAVAKSKIASILEGKQSTYSLMHMFLTVTIITTADTTLAHQSVLVSHGALCEAQPNE